MGEKLSAIKSGKVDAGISETDILLCTLQGQLHLREHLDSIVSKTHPFWSFGAFAGGIQHILDEYPRGVGPDNVTMCNCPSQRYVNKSLSLACDHYIPVHDYAYIDEIVSADFYGCMRVGYS